MAHSGHSSTPGTTFVTLATYRYRPLFQISRIAELLIESLLYYRTHGLIKLHAYVVMPSQAFLLLTPATVSLERTVAVLQRGFVERMGAIQPVWESGFQRLPIHTLRDLEKFRAHLHQLPVRAQLTATAEFYPYSSAYRSAATIPTDTATSARQLAS